MKQMLRHIHILGLMLLALAANGALAKGGELKFYSDVKAIDQTDDVTGVVTITVNGFDVGLMVNGDTEIMADGIEVGLDGLAVGSFVKVDAFFSDEGITAEEIAVVETPNEHFALRGQLTAVNVDATLPEGVDFDVSPLSSTTGVVMVSLLGTDVYLDAATRITSRNEGMGNEVPADTLVAGDRVAIRGDYHGFLYGRYIHVGSWDQGDIELEGTISALTDNGFILDIRKGGKANILIDSESDVNGEPAPGVYAEVDGRLTESLAVRAEEVVIDEDGDGDGDDDHERGYHGHGRPDWAFEERNEDRDEDRDHDHSRYSVNLQATDDSSLYAGVTIHSNDSGDDETEASFELELGNGEPNTTYTVVAWFGTNDVELGSFVTDDEGKGSLELESDDDHDSLSLVLTGDQDPASITRIDVMTDGSVVLTGDL